MCMNEYVLAVIARDRLRELQRDAERIARLGEIPRTPLRVNLGRALIRLGRRLAAPPHPEPRPSLT